MTGATLFSISFAGKIELSEGSGFWSIRIFVEASISDRRWNSVEKVSVHFLSVTAMSGLYLGDLSLTLLVVTSNLTGVRFACDG